MTDEAKALVERLRGDWPEILVEKHWMMDSDAIDKQREEAADLIETQAREIERLREALRPFADAAEKGSNVYVGVKQAMEYSPHLFSYSTAYIDAGRSAAHSHISWIDYEEARAAFAARDLKIVETEMQEKLG